jgi:hypothetical protein
MPDILIRDVPEDAVARIDAAAAQAGLSRAEYLRRVLLAQRGPAEPITHDHLARFAELTADALDPDVMRGAWL